MNHIKFYLFRLKLILFSMPLSKKFQQRMHKTERANLISMNVPKIYSKGSYPDFNLIRKLEAESDVSIILPHFLKKEDKASFIKLAKNLSKRHTVFLYEVAIESGGGSDIAQQISFFYQHYQPVIGVTSTILIGIGSNLATDIIKKIYSQKNNPILNSQFTIQRTHNNTKYNYIFDHLDIDSAIFASSLIPSQIKLSEKDKVYEEVYLCFDIRKSKWIKIMIN